METRGLGCSEESLGDRKAGGPEPVRWGSVERWWMIVKVSVQLKRLVGEEVIGVRKGRVAIAKYCW